MSLLGASADPTGNRLLAALPAQAYERLLPELEIVASRRREVVLEAAGPIPWVYFPLTSVISLLTPMADGTAIEYATVGNEGVVGLPVFLGAETMPSRAFSLVPPGNSSTTDSVVFTSPYPILRSGE